MKIKGFDKNLQCRDFQFEIGKTYDTGAKDEDLRLCSDTVFHYCDSLQKVHEFYNCDADNRYCEIEVLGKEIADGNKCGSNRIKILREIKGEELNTLLGKINGNTGLFNSGNRNSGNWNSGNHNSGNWNSGDWNSGGCNSGDWNSCDDSNGVFCTKEPTIRMFDVESDMTLSEFRNSKYHAALTQAAFPLTEWIKYTEEEKASDKKKELIGGYLKTRTYKEACAIWWKNTTEKNKKIIMSMPNFNKDKFKQITGIEVQ